MEYPCQDPTGCQEQGIISLVFFKKRKENATSPFLNYKAFPRTCKGLLDKYFRNAAQIRQQNMQAVSCQLQRPFQGSKVFVSGEHLWEDPGMTHKPLGTLQLNGCLAEI